MDEMDTRLSELTVKQFTEILIAVVGQVLDEKAVPESGENVTEDSEQIRKQKLEAILKI